MTFDYDLFVIGGGSGGVRAARVAAGGGASVALAESSRYGGTCVIRGCVPKKLMVYASEFPTEMRDAQSYGWTVHAGGFNWPRFRTALHAELDRLEGVYRGLLKGSGVATYDARATVADAHTVLLDGGQSFTARHILIATGGVPVRPDLDGAGHGIVSDDIFLMDTLPRSILVVGGGYIACEFSCILNGLGVDVTQYYRGAQILRGFDGEARGLVSEQMIDHGIDLHLGTNILDIRPERGGYAVTSTKGTEKWFQTIFFATGRNPNTAGLGLEQAGVRLGRYGQVEVNEYSQTAVPSIYAIGDVTDRINLTPVAIREAMAFVETVFGGNPTPVDHNLIPTAIFTQPEVGTVGLSEEDARAIEPIDVYCTSFKPMKEAFAKRSDRVLMKLVVSQATRRVLGCHIVAPGAAEMIQMVGIAVKMGATKEDFDRVCAVHPTMAEELVTMKAPIRKS
ncbi:MAG: glutathione-disulfide reductase [Rhodobacterales bacterium]|nr:glutathione-disulfide reductase [Rhodobacterales bacterium]